VISEINMESHKKFLVFILLAGVLFAGSCQSAVYYVDNVLGSDTNDGTCSSQAWQSLDKVNSTTFEPGDEILFRSGGYWAGQLWPKGSGSEAKPIKIGKYGEGDLPIISGMGKFNAAVKLYNQQWWEISDLEVTNYKGGDLTLKRGVYVAVEDIGIARHIHLKNLYVHNVNGHGNISYKGGSKYSGGIFFEVLGDKVKTWYDDFLVEGCRVYDTDQLGISNQSSWRRKGSAPESDWAASTNIVLRNNWIEMTGSNGLIVRASKGAIVEHNTLKSCAMKTTGNAMYSFGADDTIVQYNESYGTIFNPGDVDGAGYDSDYHCRRSTFQYNYSHDNDYGFILICNFNGVNDGTIVRYNISQGDNGFIFRTAGPTTNTYIYNNTVYVDEKMKNERFRTDNGKPKICWFKDWDGYSDKTYFYNNLIYNMSEEAYYDFGESTNNVWENNLFFGKHPDSEPNDPYKITADPMLVNPSSGGVGIDSVGGYMLQPGSPAIDAGKVIENNGGRDYFGNKLYNGKPDIGAHEWQKTDE